MVSRYRTKCEEGLARKEVQIEVPRRMVLKTNVEDVVLRVSVERMQRIVLDIIF